MKIMHRIAYNKKRISLEFLNFLREKNAKFQDTGSPLGLMVVYLFEEEVWKDELYRFLKKDSISTLIEPVYSKKEMEGASWFTIRPKYRWDYPQPEDNFGYKNTTYNSSNYCRECGCGLRQQAEFRINKQPKWGKRNFLMLNWIEDELFISNAVKDVLEKNDIKGYQLYDVIRHNKNVPIENMKQIYVKNVLQPGLIDKSVEKMRCEVCGIVKNIYKGRGFLYKKDIFERLNADIVKSAEVFGGGHVCARLIFITKNLYQLLIQNSLDKDLAFEPIFFE